jgi:hypothetical protein
MITGASGSTPLETLTYCDGAVIYTSMVFILSFKSEINENY